MEEFQKLHWLISPYYWFIDILIFCSIYWQQGPYLSCWFRDLFQEAESCVADSLYKVYLRPFPRYIYQVYQVYLVYLVYQVYQVYLVYLAYLLNQVYQVYQVYQEHQVQLVYLHLSNSPLSHHRKCYGVNWKLFWTYSTLVHKVQNILESNV